MQCPNDCFELFCHRFSFLFPVTYSSLKRTLFLLSWQYVITCPFERARGMRMAQKIYVGNMNYATTEDSLKNAFSQYGEVVSAVVIKDRYTEQSKGFGFVEMADDAAAEAAIAGLNGTEFEGRRIRVNKAEDRPRNPRPRPSYNRSEEGANASY